MRAALVALVVCGSAFANEDPDTEVARKHFTAGHAFYAAADYEHALEEFQTARRARPHPALDYNIARCLDRLERYPEAIAAYKSYLASNPADAAEMRARVHELEERVKQTRPPPRVAPVAPEAPVMLALPPSLDAPPPTNKKHTVAIVLGVLGGAAIIGGAIAVGLLVKTTTEPAWPDNTGGPHPATQ
jgi:iron complex outermembrane receptor protein